MLQVKIITSSKGGAGKTALACSLMLAALQKGKNIVLIDLNVNNLDLSRILCSSEFLVPPEGSFVATNVEDDIMLISKRPNTSLYMVFRKQPHSPLKVRDFWQFLESVVSSLSKKKSSTWLQNLELIVDTSFNVTSLFPFSMTSQITNREKYQQSRRTILELQSKVSDTIRNMVLSHRLKVEIFVLVDSLRAKSYLLSEHRSKEKTDVVPLEEYNELRYYYRLEKKIVDELGQEIVYVFTPRPIIPERGMFAVIQEAVKKILGKKRESIFYPLVSNEDINLLQRVLQDPMNQQSSFRVRTLEGFLASLNVDEAIHDFIQKPRWELFLEIEQEIFQHLITTVLHKNLNHFPHNVLIIPAFVHSMVNWSEMILSHGKIIDKKDFEIVLGYFLQQVILWYERRVASWEKLTLDQ